ncbi:bifunctional [glutamate--ammonia ligase]-adenylyl-L-tyrosine phosphorylase/[glutamate--ammonia-ligase] adenylyltransferase [uncultured Thiodictyon sp.]|uniref:bifunctional [glutamate--ammonia ligase]-adenylyl-L-tyrosine phosphorylase/[glutamate--ammonia-ligase] adenylyltransferase n=1 Tax=uncultured Thiodictyon sp. TaxID=1846217 RepID=UPI0025D865E6|nr:bifunctional [glutamate--ammonia ligase]-adenylyl-L-tyrosine phosphorylase/[glutamate--ammonia-ligase] adenylyltransferase [uncultured Thiodictyon sp.]
MTATVTAALHALTEIPERCWQVWLDWAQTQGRAVPLAADVAAIRARVWEGSDYVAQAAARHPEDFAVLLDSGDLGRADRPGDLAARLAAALAGVADEPALHRVLRLARRREMTRIIWRDLGGLAGLEETLEDLSELADCCIRAALDRLHDWTCTELGTPRDDQGREQRLLVIGMGKLGARELNLSSDIDLIFAFPAPGQVAGRARPLDNQQFFTRLAQRLVQALHAQTVDGFVFRVDTRLRPFGDSGPLVASFDALEDYYQSQAREWERYAMIKARVLTGEPQDRVTLEALLRPFVYRRYLDFGAIDSLREMKQMIAKELYARGMDANIKLGPGGIREIEFIGQALQLVRGGRDPALQVRPIRQVLALLAARDLLPPAALPALDDAYCFLRLVENRIQAYKDKQTHLLPSDDLGRLRLARSMDCPDWASFAPLLEGHRQRVQGLFDQVFTPRKAEPAGPDQDLVALWRGTLDAERAREILVAHHFADPAAAQERLAAFRLASARKGMSAKGAERLQQVLPQALQVIADSESPDLALERVLKVLESVVRRTAYLAMLIERPMALAQLARLAGMSPWIAEQIARQPLLLDELIDPGRLYALRQRADLETELDALLAPIAREDLEQQMERLRQFAHGNVLRVAAADLTGGVPLMKISDYLTEIAEVAVGRTLALTFAHLSERHGRPAGLADTDTGVLILGYGKLGGLELGYGSDLDLVFLHGADEPAAETAGPKAISAEQFYNRLGQRLIHMMTTHTPSGILYELDMRLRPDGNKGMLVRSISAFADYQTNSAWTWEHQALIRARPVAGDPGLAERFAAIRRATICRQRDPERLREDVRAMRKRMRETLDKSGRGRFDLKQGRGGIADIEFMVQYSVLRWAADHQELADWTDNIRQLETLARLDLLPGTAAAQLTAAYKRLRGAYHRSALQDQPKTVADDQLLPERERVNALWLDLIGD